MTHLLSQVPSRGELYSSAAGDFTVTVNAGGKTVTISDPGFALTPNAIQVAQLWTVAGTVFSKQDIPINTIGISGFVISFEDLGSNFVGTERVEVVILGPKKVLLSSIYDPLRDKIAEVDSLGNVRTAPTYALVGTSFSGLVLDTSFWTVGGVVGTGAATLNGEVKISTGITANSAVNVSSIRRAQKVPGATNEFKFAGRLGTVPQVNNVRRVGCYDDNNGFFFQANGTTFGIGSRKSAGDTIVNSGDFNGEQSSFSLDTHLHRFVIQYTVVAVKFIVDDVLIHTIKTDVVPVSTFELPIRVENINSGGNTTDNTIYMRLATIVRIGGPVTAGKTVGITGTGTTAQVLKRSAGILKNISVLDNAGTVAIYDGVSTAGTLVGTIDGSKVFGSFPLNAQFGIGLTLVANGATILVTYE